MSRNGRRFRLRKKPVTALVYADGQSPFHDRRTWRLIVDFARRMKPSLIINLGDDADCYHWSSFSKSQQDAPPCARRWHADAEITATQDKWEEIREAVPNARRIYLEGNHEARVRNFFQRNAPDVETKDTDFESVFKVHDWWDYYGLDFNVGKLWFTHGSTYAKYAARQMLEAWGSSVVFGHAHRNLFWSHHLKNGDEHAAWGVPCHMTLDPHYLHRPDWSQGFGWARFALSGWFNMAVIPIIRHRYVFGNGFFAG